MRSDRAVGVIVASGWNLFGKYVFVMHLAEGSCLANASILHAASSIHPFLVEEKSLHSIPAGLRGGISFEYDDYLEMRTLIATQLLFHRLSDHFVMLCMLGNFSCWEQWLQTRAVARTFVRIIPCRTTRGQQLVREYNSVEGDRSTYERIFEN